MGLDLFCQQAHLQEVEVRDLCLRTARQVLGWGSSEYADDAAQEALIKIHIAWRSSMFRNVESARGFAATVARREAIQILRRMQRDRSHTSGELHDDYPDASPDPEEETIRTEVLTERVRQAAAVDNALRENLTVREYDAFRLRYAQGLTSKEVGERVGVPPSTVRNWWDKARNVGTRLGEDR